MNAPVRFCTYSSPPVCKREILRYAGSPKGFDGAEALLENCLREAESVLSYRVCYCELPVLREGGALNLGFAKTESRDLARMLRDCDRVILFAATVGAELDRRIARASVTSLSEALMLGALGNERVESLCDAFCEDLRAHYAPLRLTPRFSPGYGDLPLSLQREIFSCLSPARMGLTLGENLLMSPSKSVTALVGIKTLETTL
jgi:hypothetical protein